jgi:hypothetical protein
MISQDEQDNSDFGLPPGIIRKAASEYVTRYLMPEIEAFLAMATDALANDCEIDNEATAALLWDRIQSMAKGLKVGQATANHAAIYFRLWTLFDEAENAAPLQVNTDTIYNVSNDEDEGGETEAA